jgi:type IV secretory pathway VirB2 component (pilin)
MTNLDPSTKSKRAVLMVDIFAAAVVLLATTASAYAGVNTPMGAVVCMIVSFVYGNMGRGLAVLAICIVGVGAMLGKVSWGLAILVGVGIGILFGSMALASWIYSGGTTASLNMCS